LRTQTRFYFDEGQSQVKPEFAALLTAHGRYLATHPKLRARIEGDADAREADDRKALGLRRARAVRQAILAAGAKSRQLEVVRLGDAQPRQGDDEGSGVENRRVDLRYLE
ncbi:MAG: OmpA family protein, partial [Zoogloeaceae bacterium]|jgi:peptidoglycan-associated lipoprotein|nr:OmpA family protein [Zoogloeaceae bacterium]